MIIQCGIKLGLKYQKKKKKERKKDGNNNPVCETAKEIQMYTTVFWTLWERARWDDLGEWH